MKNNSYKMFEKTKRIIIHLLIFIMSLATTIAMRADTQHYLVDIEHDYGIYAIDWIKMVLGILIMIGGFGFFITTSARRAHWPVYIRRIFTGIFIFCNIASQAFFNVINVPNNKKLVCMLGRCVKKISKRTA
jgi:hypothetical protein